MARGWRTCRFEDRRGGDQSLTGYSHIRKDRGYVFLINPDAIEHIAELTLELDAPQPAKFQVEELYPGGMALEGPEGGLYPHGGKLKVTVPAKQMRILWICPSLVGKSPSNLQAENARTGAWRRYIGDWSVSKKASTAATLRAEFQFPSDGKAYLSRDAPEADVRKEPWNQGKA